MTDPNETLPDSPVAVEEEISQAELVSEQHEPVAMVTPPVDFGPVPEPPEPGPANPSPDGQRMAFLQHDANYRIRLWLAALDGTPPTPVELTFEPVLDDDGPQWSPDGQWLALTGLHPAGDRTAIWLLHVEQHLCRLLVDHPAADRSPRWSPDGSWVAFVSHRDGRDAICVAAPDGTSAARQVTFAPPGQDDRDPCWSPDSSRIAFCRRIWEGEQTGDHIWTVDIRTGETKQVTKKLARRHGLQWAPNRAQVAYVSDEGEWDNIAVVNPDNAAGWNLASENGDKACPRYSPDGNRILYTRLQHGVTRLMDRGVNASSAEPYDPGNGVASAGRWVPGSDVKRVLYRFAPATGAPRFIIQEAKKDTERVDVPLAVPWDAGRPLVEPVHIEFETWSGLKLGGLYYRQAQWVGRLPAIVYLTDTPHLPRDARFRAPEQALAAAGFAVFAPSLHGTPGYGRKVINLLRDQADTEVEASDLVDVIRALQQREDIEGDRIALVGWGHGGTLALVFAGGRPDHVQAVVAIDPITDWDSELDHGSSAYRAWHFRQLGLPAVQPVRHLLRTPATFIGAVTVPLLLLGTDADASRTRQLDSLTALLRELNVPFEQEVSVGESPWTTAARAAAFVRTVVGPNPAPPAEAMRTETI